MHEDDVHYHDDVCDVSPGGDHIDDSIRTGTAHFIPIPTPTLHATGQTDPLDPRPTTNAPHFYDDGGERTTFGTGCDLGGGTEGPVTKNKSSTVLYLCLSSNENNM